MNILKRQLAISILSILYVSAGLLSKVRIFRDTKRREGPVLLIGTFHNPNWIFAHVEPIAQAMPVVVVTDEPIVGIANLSNLCAPKWLQKILSRAGAKFIYSIYAALKTRPSVCMGYHIFPAAIIALISATLSGARAAYQVTSGQLELEGGGWHAENVLLVALQKKSILVEKAVHFMVRQFDLVIVRGTLAKMYLRELGYSGTLEVVTGSVFYPEKVDNYEMRKIDLLFVGRLSECKQLNHLIQAFKSVVSLRPKTKLVIVGDGPEMHSLKKRINDSNLSDNVQILGQQKNVEFFQTQAIMNILTSRWEGVSIAMLEAMAYGVVPIVFDVGDLRDFVTPETGYLLAEGDIEGIAESILSLLKDKNKWRYLSENCRKIILATSSKKAVCYRWERILNSI